LETNPFTKIAKNFCQQAENDRKEVAAAITPLWVISGVNIGVAGVRGRVDDTRPPFFAKDGPVCGVRVETV
jgi:hypothetical protein